MVKTKERDLFSVKTDKLKKQKGIKKKQLKKSLEKNLDNDFVDYFSTSDDLSYKNITEGQCILGCVMEIHKFELCISLPNSMVGYVPISNISRSYKNLLSKISQDEEIEDTVYSLEELFTFGQVLITKVTSVCTLDDGKSKVMLSIIPGDVNSNLHTPLLVKGSIFQGAIQAIEENGFIIETGISKLRASFLPLKWAPQDKILGVGSVFVCAVKKILERDENDLLRVKLTCDASFMREHPVGSDDDSAGMVAIPGSWIKATVKEVNKKSGLILSSSDYKVVVRRSQYASRRCKMVAYARQQVVVCRVLYCAGMSNVLFCSLKFNLCQSNVLNSFASNQCLKVGDIFSEGRVVKLTSSGLHLRLPKGQRGFCPLNKLRDYDSNKNQGGNINENNNILKNLKRQFDKKKTYPGKILHVNLMDEVFVVSLHKSMLIQGIKNVSSVGDRISVKVIEHTPHGAVVALSKTQNGFVQTHHLTNSFDPSPESKRHVGQVYDARILRHLPEENPYLTLKEDLVNSNLPIVTKVHSSIIGTVTIGTIVKLYDEGLLIELFGGITVYVSSKKIPPSKLDSIKVGNVVECKIIDASNDKLFASLYLEGKRVKLEFMDIVNCTVISIEDEKLRVKMDGHEDAVAFITKEHLDDDFEYSVSIFKLLKEGDQLKNVVVFKRLKLCFYLSLKASFLQFKTKYKNPLVVGHEVPSVITDICPQTITVIFHNQKRVKEHSINKQLALNQLVKDLSFVGLQIGQTWFLKFLKIDSETQKPVFSSLLRNVLQEKEQTSLQLLFNYLKTEEILSSIISNVNDGEKKLDSLRIGQKFVSKVKAITQNGALVYIPFLGLDGVIPREHYDSSPPVLGHELKVKLLHVDYKNLCLELTANCALKKLLLPHDPFVKIGEDCVCEVLLCKKEFILGRLKQSHNGQIVYLPSKRHMNDLTGRHSFYEIGKKYKVRIKYKYNEMVLADLLDHCKSGTRKNSAIVSLNNDFGEINIVSEIPVDVLKSSILCEDKYTRNDFLNKARVKINLVTQRLSLKHYEELSDSEKMSILKKDDIPQLSEELYCNNVAEIRKARKKIEKLYGTKLAKRKLSENEGKQQKLPNKKKKLKVVANIESDENQMVDTGINGSEIEEDETDGHDGNINDNENALSNCLKIAYNDFDWTGEVFVQNDLNGADISESEEEMDVQKEKKSVKKLTRLQKEQIKVAEEKKTRQLELQRVEKNRIPETALDFEENIEKSPHSASAWIEYISFHLENAETEKAKAIASRALSIIPPNLEDEKLSLWNVLLKLEVMYGSSEDVQNSFKEALITNDQLKVFYIMVDIYSDANKFKEAEEVLKIMTKKFSQEKDVWIRCGEFFFRSANVIEARKSLDRSLLSLPKNEHVHVVNRFAQLELKFGDAERGRTMFETLLSNFPKRLDIWNTYVDLLVKQKDIEAARAVLERMLGLKLRMNSMRNVFKKILEFEKINGTPQRVEAIKKKVEEYVTSALKGNE